MTRHRLVIFAAVAVLAVVASGPFRLSSHMAAQSRAAMTTVNWPLHNLDLAGTRIDRTSSR